MRKRKPRELDAAAVCAAWYRELRRTTNPAFWPLYADRHLFLVLKGGGGSGKSVFAGRKILERATSEPGHRILICRKVARTLRESCFAQLRAQILAHYPDAGAKVNLSEMTITFANGSKLLFAGLDDVEKLKSIYEITSIWVEEATELKEGDLNQLIVRMRGARVNYYQIILTFNPVSINHWIKARFFDRKLPDVRVHESNYLDNPHLPEENRRQLEAFRETDEYYYAVYCLGEWGVTGRSVFNARAVANRMREAPAPRRVGAFGYAYDGLMLERAVFEDDPEGAVAVWREPEAGVPYVIGADTAGEGSDQFVAQVLDNRTGEQVARLRQCYDEDVFAKQLYCLGMWYNGALIGVECNYSTYPVMELERLRYPRQYVRESVDDYTHRVRTSFGVRTDPRTRPVMIAGLIRAVRGDGMEMVNDRVTLEEMQTFVRNEDWRAEAEAGAHDDCVMALCIAHYIRPQQRYTAAVDGESGGTEHWTADMWEDYRAASREEKEMLRRKFGRGRDLGDAF